MEDERLLEYRAESADILLLMLSDSSGCSVLF